jgi:DNA-binding NtrC family response regulator
MPSRLLIVDDDPRQLLALREALQVKFPHTSIATALSAEEGLAQLSAAGGMDAIICDVRLPGLSGLELLRQVRERHADCVIILITGQMGEVEHQALQMGASGFLHKPVDVARLSVLLSRAVGQVKLTKALQERHRQSHSGPKRP